MQDDFQTNDVVNVFLKAKNLNSAVKAFLKQEGKAAPGNERLAKDLREVLLSNNRERAELFVQKRLEKDGLGLAALALYAHRPLVTEIASQIVERHAEEFNATYTIENGKVQVSNKRKFDQILGEVNTHVDSQLTQAELSGSQFMQFVVLGAIFDGPVLEYIRSD